jgi:hypothetical protein
MLTRFLATHDAFVAALLRADTPRLPTSTYRPCPTGHTALALVKLRHSWAVQLDVLIVVRQLPGCSGAASGQATDDGLVSIDIVVQLPDGSRR